VKPLDLTGYRSGRLVAIEPTEARIARSVVWRCRCDCGGTKLVPAADLRRGDTGSCGCLPRGRQTYDLEGQTHGALTVLHHAFDGASGAVWRVRCTCGREFLRNRKAIVHGRGSCGRKACRP
jgi:hypothetical protein